MSIIRIFNGKKQDKDGHGYYKGGFQNYCGELMYTYKWDLGTCCPGIFLEPI